MATDWKGDLKLLLGEPLIDVELYDNAAAAKDDFDFIEERTLRVINTYMPQEHIVRKDVASSGALFGEGSIDLTTDSFTNVLEAYVLKSKTGSTDILLPWSVARIWEQLWIGKSEFIGCDLLQYQNELALLHQVSNTKFSWRYYHAEKKLYVTNVPSFAIGIGVRGFKATTALNSLDATTLVYELAIKYASALAKQKIAMFMRKYKVEGLEMTGQDLMQEGRDDEEKYLNEIKENYTYPGGINW